MPRHLRFPTRFSCRLRHAGAVGLLLLATLVAPAVAGGVSHEDRQATAAQLRAWLGRMHDSQRNHSYVGTYVVSSANSLSSARIWHACQGEQQYERIDSLNGAPRTVLRHNDQVLTLWPETGLARSERRETLGLFPDRLRAVDEGLAEHYRIQLGSQADRVAGVSAERVQLLPRDKLRFGYRIWVEPESGLVVKLQTLDGAGQVLEQAAFSELQFGAPVKVDALLRMMNRLDGYRLEKVQPVKTTLAAEGWSLKALPGFRLMHCHKRQAHSTATGGLHCAFTDGLASVSVFLEPVPSKADAPDVVRAMGATHTLRTHVHQHAATLMGEVPPATLKLFASALERRKANP